MSHKQPVSTDRGKHLTAVQRMSIEAGIKAGKRVSEIASDVHKDPSTIRKEIRLHRELMTGCKYPIDCLHYAACAERKVNPMACCKHCASYTPFRCIRRDRSPGACSGCARITGCHYDKYRYRAGSAEQEYRDRLVSTREGLNLTPEEGEHLASVVSPLIRQGQSPYMIVTTHPELGISTGTLYNYISAGLLAPYGITDSSLPMKAKRRAMKKKSRLLYKKKTDRSYLKGRTYDDYTAFMAKDENRYRWVLQLDTVYNSVGDGPFIETMLFVPCTFLMAFYQEKRTDEAMVAGMNCLDRLLGPDLFEETAGVILTDRGTEFVMAEQFETRTDGTQRAHIFYCDPMASCQKAGVENSHELLRRVVPKNTEKLKSAGIDYTDLRALGLVNQEALNLALSHINSVPRLSLDGKTPIQVMKFKKPELWKKLQKSGIREIPPDEVVLKKDLLKAFRTGIADTDLEPENTGIITNSVRPRLHKTRKQTRRKNQNEQQCKE